MQTMYPAKVNSPTTMLAGGIDAAVDIIPLFDSSVLPAAPNLAAIGTGEDTETILYEVINGNNLETVTRGFQGIAKPWASGTQVARLITAYDLDTLRANLTTHDADADAHHVQFENLVEDATPQLGGDLDAEGHKIHDQVSPYATKTSAYTTTVDDEIIAVSTTFGAVTITLGSAACRAGQIIVIKDKGGHSGVSAITIATEGAELINGAATDTINRNSFSKQYYSDGSNWFDYSLTDDHDVFGLLETGLFANLPLFGTINRLYFASDTKILYRDSGFGWGAILRGETAIRLAQLAEKEHSSLTSLDADDHPQYTKHSLATAVSDFLVASGADVFIKRTLAQVRTLLNWAADIATHSALTTGIHGVGASTVDSVAARIAAIATHAGLTVTHGATGAIVGTTNTQTLTNKTLIATSNVVEQITTVASDATPNPTGGSLRNFYTITALAAGATFAAPSGTPANANKLIIRIKDNGTARALGWNAIYRRLEFALPTTTVISKTMYLGFIYNSADSKWDLLAINEEA